MCSLESSTTYFALKSVSSWGFAPDPNGGLTLPQTSSLREESAAQQCIEKRQQYESERGEWGREHVSK